MDPVRQAAGETSTLRNNDYAEELARQLGALDPQADNPPASYLGGEYQIGEVYARSCILMVASGGIVMLKYLAS